MDYWNLSVVQVTQSFLVIPNCPHTLLECDLLTMMCAQINFTPEGAKVFNGTGHPIPVLSVELNDEYRLLETLRELNHNIKA